MGATKRQKLRRGQTAKGEEFYYLRRPIASRAKLRIVKDTPDASSSNERTGADANDGSETNNGKDSSKKKGRKIKKEND